MSLKSWYWRPAGIGDRRLFLSGVMSFLRRWLMLWGDGDSGEGTAIFMSFKYLNVGRRRVTEWRTENIAPDDEYDDEEGGRRKGLMGYHVRILVDFVSVLFGSILVHSLNHLIII